MPLLQEIEDALHNRSNERNPAFIDRHGTSSFADVLRELVSLDELLTAKYECDAHDRIAAITLNSTQAVLVEWATYRLNGIWIGIPWREREPERIVGIIKASQPKLLFCGPRRAQFGRPSVCVEVFGPQGDRPLLAARA